MAKKNDPSIKGKSKTGVSKWELLDQLKLGLKDLPDSVVERLGNESSLGEQRKILAENGLPVAQEIDGKFLHDAIQQFMSERVSLIADDAQPKKRNLWRVGHGRHLVAYSEDDFDWIMKMPHADDDTDIVLNHWLRKGYALAKERLNGLAAPTFVFNAIEEDTRPFFYLLADQGLKSTPIAIVQKKVIPTIEYIEDLAKQGRRDEAKEVINKYKRFVIAMYRRGVFDTDWTNPYGNYGIDLSTGDMVVFDFGDLDDDEDYARLFLMEHLDKMNKYFYDDLELAAGSEIASYFAYKAFTLDDYYSEEGESLFGVDLKSQEPNQFRMTFPHDELTVRRMFTNHHLHPNGSDRPNAEHGARMAVQKARPVSDSLRESSTVIGAHVSPPDDVRSKRDFISRVIEALHLTLPGRLALASDEGIEIIEFSPEDYPRLARAQSIPAADDKTHKNLSPYSEADAENAAAILSIFSDLGLPLNPINHAINPDEIFEKLDDADKTEAIRWMGNLSTHPIKAKLGNIQYLRPTEGLKSEIMLKDADGIDLAQGRIWLLSNQSHIEEGVKLNTPIAYSEAGNFFAPLTTMALQVVMNALHENKDPEIKEQANQLYRRLAKSNTSQVLTPVTEPLLYEFDKNGNYTAVAIRSFMKDYLNLKIWLERLARATAAISA
jgi:hypothetical protein